jgi:hypothetical protein
MFVNKAGTVVKYETRNQALRSFPPFQMISEVGVGQFKRDMLFRRTSHDEVQFIKKCHDSIADYFRELDLYVLDRMNPSYSVEECAERLVEIDGAISRVFDGFSPEDPRDRDDFAREHVVPTLLHLLRGVVTRSQDGIYISQQPQRPLPLPSRNLYDHIIQRHPPHIQQFVLETLSKIPPEVITEEQREEKQKIFHRVEYLNIGLGSEHTAYEFRLGHLWR